MKIFKYMAVRYDYLILILFPVIGAPTVVFANSLNIVSNQMTCIQEIDERINSSQYRNNYLRELTRSPYYEEHRLITNPRVSIITKEKEILVIVHNEPRKLWKCEIPYRTTFSSSSHPNFDVENYNLRLPSSILNPQLSFNIDRKTMLSTTRATIGTITEIKKVQYRPQENSFFETRPSRSIAEYARNNYLLTCVENDYSSFSRMFEQQIASRVRALDVVLRTRNNWADPNTFNSRTIAILNNCKSTANFAINPRQPLVSTEINNFFTKRSLNSNSAPASCRTGQIRGATGACVNDFTSSVFQSN